ncbi:MAG: oxygenase MpaB family protein [Pseudonocardiaceae bacterium]
MAGMTACYAVSAGAKLLHTTHQLDHPRRRLAESGQFCLYMMDENPFKHGGHFVPAIQKVRLIHAAVRHLLRVNKAWDEEQYGVPIHQEDMLGALMLFSVLTLRGLERLGVPVTKQEAEDFYHTWRVVGSMLGIPDDIMPTTLAGTAELYDLVTRRNWGPSPEGAALTRNLISTYAAVVPGKAFDGVVPALIRYLLGEEAADWMEVPHTTWEKMTHFLPKLNHAVGEVEHHHALARKVLDKAGQLLLKAQVRSLAQDKHISFDIPGKLCAHWGVTETEN